LKDKLFLFILELMEIKSDQSENTSEIKLPNKEKNGLANQIFQEIKEAKTEEDQKDLATKLAKQIKEEQKIAMVNKELAKILKENALIDSLTCLPNREYAENNLKWEIKNAKRYSEPLSILVVDVDKLKLWNDEDESHLTGDEAIKSTAKAIQAGVRDSDFPARWAGDEFLVIIPRSDKENATLVAKRILDKVEETTRYC